MKFKEILTAIGFYLAVPKCVSCRERLSKDEDTLCKKCRIKYNQILFYDCSVCGKELNLCTCSTPYLKAHFIHKIIKRFRYIPNEENAANMLIYSMKRENRSDVFNFLSRELCSSFENFKLNTEDFIITNVPRRRSAIKRYGYDHAAVLAKRIGKLLGIEYCSLLKSKNKKAQKQNHGKEERLKNTNFKYKRHIPDVKRKRIILVDDIITTGISMGAAATLIHGLGAKEIIAACIAIAYKDEYTQFK